MVHVREGTTDDLLVVGVMLDAGSYGMNTKVSGEQLRGCYADFNRMFSNFARMHTAPTILINCRSSLPLFIFFPLKIHCLPVVRLYKSLISSSTRHEPFPLLAKTIVANFSNVVQFPSFFSGVVFFCALFGRKHSWTTYGLPLRLARRMRQQAKYGHLLLTSSCLPALNTPTTSAPWPPLPALRWKPRY